MPSSHSLGFAILAVSLFHANAVSCLNENLEAVGWFVILKQNSGLGYAYMDSESPSLSNPRINGATLNSYSNSLGKSFGFLVAW